MAKIIIHTLTHAQRISQVVSHFLQYGKLHALQMRRKGHGRLRGKGNEIFLSRKADGTVIGALLWLLGDGKPIRIPLRPIQKELHFVRLTIPLPEHPGTGSKALRCWQTRLSRQSRSVGKLDHSMLAQVFGRSILCASSSQQFLTSITVTCFTKRTKVLVGDPPA